MREEDLEDLEDLVGCFSHNDLIVGIVYVKDIKEERDDYVSIRLVWW